LARTVSEHLNINDVWQVFGQLWDEKPETLRSYFKNHRGQVHDSMQNHGTSPHGSKALDAAYSIAFPNSTPINVNKKKRITQQ
jgi:hypothetical protein